MLYAQSQKLLLMDRIKNIFLNLDKSDFGVENRKIIGFIKAEFGATEKKATEYIRDLLDADFIKKDELGILWLNKKKATKQEKEIEDILHAKTDA